MIDGWPGSLLATVFVLTTALCGLSLGAHGPRRGVRVAVAEANHVVMGVGMVLMATPLTMSLVPPAVGATVFGVAGAGWLAALLVTRRRGRPLGSPVGRDRCTAHPTHLLLLDAAMVVMFLAMVPTTGAPPAAGMPGMPGMSGAHAGHAGHGGAGGSLPAGLEVVVGLLALYLLAHTVATVVAVARRAGDTTTSVSSGAGTGAVGTGAVGTGAVGSAVVGAPALPRPLRVLAHGPVQLLGQAGMSLAMVAMLVVLL